MPKLFIYGFPGLYGGAGTELYHQIKVWLQMEMNLAIIPTDSGYKNEPMYQEMLNEGISIYKEHDFSAVTSEDAVIAFCNSFFLDNAWFINKITKRTIFVNCMTYLFPTEIDCHEKGYINFSLYQRQEVLTEHEKELGKLNSNCQFIKFFPYFDSSTVEFSLKNQNIVHIGRISRDSADKYSEYTVPIYEEIVSNKEKRGHFLGFGKNALTVVGKLPDWIKAYKNHTELPVKKFYETVDFIVQPTNTVENWPRIGFEAMLSGKPLVVDNRGGWKNMIEHGVTGFLCDTPKDFVYYASKLANEYELREDIAYEAAERAANMSSIERSRESWERVFTRVFQ